MDHKGVARVDGLGQPVPYRFGFANPGTEQAVPHDQDRAKIAVLIPPLHAVVHAMVGWRIEPAVEPRQLANGFGVYPLLVTEDEQEARTNQRRVKTHEDGCEIEPRREESIHD
jgi:hypothetical protein